MKIDLVCTCTLLLLPQVFDCFQNCKYREKKVLLHAMSSEGRHAGGAVSDEEPQAPVETGSFGRQCQYK